MCIQALVENEKANWDDEFAIIGDSLEFWNEHIVSFMHGVGLPPQDARNNADVLKQYKIVAHKIARSRGWQYDKDTDAYVVAPITDEEKKTVMHELAMRERERRTHGNMQKTAIKDVWACWDGVSRVLIIQDWRKGEKVEHCWANVPESDYQKLFEPDAKKSLKELIQAYGDSNVDDIVWTDAEIAL